jgi:putative ABC transport system ATP-binding protein
MTKNTEHLLVAKDISKVVEGPEGKLTILKSTDLLIESGDSVAIVGPSGSGKTTLLGLLAGLDLPTTGQVFFQGTELTTLDEDQRAKLRSSAVGFVFQSFHLLASLTALENAMLPMELAAESDAEERAMAILRRVGLADRAHHYPNQLSGGEKQRVAIARAFSSKPSLLFADEPTGNLDTATGRQISDLLFELNEHDETTLVLVTHDIGLAKRCQQVVQLEAGAVVETTIA